MGLDHSDGEEASGSSQVCILCKTHISESDLYKTKCGHSFHKKCMKNHLTSKKSCPTCKAACPGEPLIRTDSSVSRNTRHQNRLVNLQNEDNSQVNMGAEDSSQARLSGREDVHSIVTEAVRGMQNELLTQLSEKMTILIEANLASRPSQGPFRIAANASPSMDQLLGLETGQPTSMRDTGHVNLSPGSNLSELSQRPDKVSHIMNGWKLRFSGSAGGISIDNFIYRVQALTHQTLGGNFGILCGNASALFEGKADDFYWRYHKSVQVVRWDELCFAFRRQFRDTRTDVDIRELIRDRKQKENENFDSFYDAVVQLTDSLDCPLGEKALVEILRRNLRPEIRHEILNIQTDSISRLREICRRRECFLEEVKRDQIYKKGSPFKNHVSELLDGDNKYSESEFFVNEEGTVEAVSLICWNCRKEGHRYQDCTAPRKVFCYGCGARNTYKPSCQRCLKNIQQNTQVPRSRCVQKTQSTSTENEIQ